MKGITRQAYVEELKKNDPTLERRWKRLRKKNQLTQEQAARLPLTSPTLGPGGVKAHVGELDMNLLEYK